MSHVDPDLEEKLKSASQWETINEHQDVVGLLKLIRAPAHQHDEVKQGMVSFVEMDFNLYLGYQPNGQDISTFYKLFKARCDVINTYGGQAGFHPQIYTARPKTDWSLPWL